MWRPWLTLGVSVAALAWITWPALRMEAVLPDARTFPPGSDGSRSIGEQSVASKMPPPSIHVRIQDHISAR